MRRVTKPAQPALFKKPGFRYRPQYGLVVVCRNEREQRQLYRRLHREGLKLRVVVV